MRLQQFRHRGKIDGAGCTAKPCIPAGNVITEPPQLDPNCESLELQELMEALLSGHVVARTFTVEDMAKAQFNNMTVEGFPLHADLAKYEHVCKTQRILKKCRVELESKFGKCGGEEEKLTKTQRNAILAQAQGSGSHLAW